MTLRRGDFCERPYDAFAACYSPANFGSKEIVNDNAQKLLLKRINIPGYFFFVGNAIFAPYFFTVFENDEDG